MGLRKGQTNNPAGRPKGIPNRLTKELRCTLKAVIDQELENLPEILDSLEGKDRLEFICKLLPYVLPKVESVGMTEGEPFDLLDF